MIIKTVTVWKFLKEIHHKRDAKLYIQNNFITTKEAKENFLKENAKNANNKGFFWACWFMHDFLLFFNSLKQCG